MIWPPNIYWLSGMAGTGKATIAHSLCELLDEKGILGASFLCARSDSVLRDPSHIVPTIVSMLTRLSPPIRSKLCEVLESNPDTGSPNILPCNSTASLQETKTYKIVIIDAMNECSHQMKVMLLIKTIYDGVSNIPLKFFISNHPEE